jgi:hypothetical protein
MSLIDALNEVRFYCTAFIISTFVDPLCRIFLSTLLSPPSHLVSIHLPFLLNFRVASSPRLSFSFHLLFTSTPPRSLLNISFTFLFFIHFTSLHFTSLHFTSLHSTSLHFTSHPSLSAPLHTSPLCVSCLVSLLSFLSFFTSHYSKSLYFPLQS